MVDERKIEIIKKGKPFSIFDCIVILAALALAVSFIVFSCATKTAGSKVVLRNARSSVTTLVGEYTTGGKTTEFSNKDGKIEFELTQEVTIKIKVKDGIMTVMIKDGAAWIEDSPCKNKV
jgi:hypothetical protein